MDDYTLTNKKFCTLAKSIPADGNVSFITVKGHGSSMAPFLKSEETLFIRPIGLTELISIGDIVAFTDKKAEMIIVHRVIAKKKERFKTKGDNRKKSDGWLMKNRIIGIVTQKKKISGKMISMNRWENRIIAFFSRSGLLNYMLLPFGRLIKKKLQGF